jgi:hypothetical protein
MGFVKYAGYFSLVAALVPFALRCITRFEIPAHMTDHSVVYDRELIGPSDRQALARLVQEMGSTSFHTNNADVKSYTTLREHIGEVVIRIHVLNNVSLYVFFRPGQ